MTERALDADRLQRSGAVEDARHDDDSVKPQQRDRHGRIVQVDVASLELLEEGVRECVDIDLQSHGERGRRADAGADAAECRTLDGAVQLQASAPERLVAKRIEPERLASLPY